MFCFSFVVFVYCLFLEDIPVILPPTDELVFTEKHLGHGLQPGETELPHESAGKQIIVVGILPSLRT